MHNVPKWLQQKLDQRKEKNNFRTLKLGNKLVDFSSNDYLGVARNQELRSEIQRLEFNQELPNGATGSRLLTGNLPVFDRLEKRLAAFFRAPAALLFNSGYSANLALLSSLPQRGDTVIYDQAIHACVKDGARLSPAKHLSFRHNDPRELQKKLRQSTGNRFVVIESLYSMDGDFPPVEAIIEVCREFDALLIMDEAHTTGWSGPAGCGWAVERNIDQALFARVHTFGKAMGIHGACVVGSQQLIEYLVNFARPFIFTTAMSPHAAVAIDCALNFITQKPLLTSQLIDNIEFYLQEIDAFGAGWSRNIGSPIQWIKVGGNQEAKDLGRHLEECGYEVYPILSPTVPEGSERLRICLHSFNSEEEIAGLIRSVILKL